VTMPSTIKTAMLLPRRWQFRGKIEGWRPHDEKDHAMYCEALSELAKLIDRQRNGPSAGGSC